MRSILITGANRGLGLEFARQYAADHWNVVAACRRPAEAYELARLGVEVVQLDVADALSIAALAQRLSGRPFDILLNNAGIYGVSQEFGALDPDEWVKVFRTNSIGPLKMVEAFLPHVLAGTRKLMAFVTSRMGSIADNEAGGSYIYRSSKTALNAAVRSLTIDLRPRGVATVLLHPGWARTDMGGAGASVDPSESVAGMRRVMADLRSGETGEFRDYTGAPIPW